MALNVLFKAGELLGGRAAADQQQSRIFLGLFAPAAGRALGRLRPLGLGGLGGGALGAGLGLPLRPLGGLLALLGVLLGRALRLGLLLLLGLGGLLLPLGLLAPLLLRLGCLLALCSLLRGLILALLGSRSYTTGQPIPENKTKE